MGNSKSFGIAEYGNLKGVGIQFDYTCSTCGRAFPPKTLFQTINEHYYECATNSNKREITEDYMEDLEYAKKLGCIKNFKWGFDQKIRYLREYLKTLKEFWKNEISTVRVTRENTLEESMKQLKGMSLLRELKIIFEGEEGIDIGGVLREWFMVLFKEIESKELCKINVIHLIDLFQKTNCNDYSVIPSYSLKPTEKNLNYFYFIGQLLSKAILEDITVNICFSKLIYKMVLDEPLSFEDLNLIDTQMYQSLQKLKKMNPSLIPDLCMYYVYEYKDENDKLCSEDIIPNGSNILVTDINDYIEKRLNFMLSKYRIFVNQIKLGLFESIPPCRLKVFNAHEFDILVNGKPFIDVAEWKLNSIYNGKYNNKHKVINWFWNAMAKQPQENLRKILQFATGTSRTPINGFQKLQSHNGEVVLFNIEPANYTKEKKNFIKAHTCFNRIDLPMFSSETEVVEAINFILCNEVIGFGIE